MGFFFSGRAPGKKTGVGLSAISFLHCLLHAKKDAASIPHAGISIKVQLLFQSQSNLLCDQIVAGIQHDHLGRFAVIA